MNFKISMLKVNHWKLQAAPEYGLRRLDAAFQRADMSASSKARTCPRTPNCGTGKLLRAVSLWSLLVLVLSAASVFGDSLLESKPKFVLSLNLNEFSILNVSEMDGLLKYGGSGDFQLKMAKVESNVVWNVTIDSPRLMELLGIFVGERTMKLVQTIDPNNLDPNQKIALDAIKSLTQKLEYARTHPLWDSIKLSGAVVQQGTNWLLQTKDDSFKITGDRLADYSRHFPSP